MNAELISLIKWYIFDDGSIQNKLLNLQGEQLNKERLICLCLTVENGTAVRFGRQYVHLII